MNQKWLSMVILAAAAGMLLGLNSCAHDQQLVSIQVQPTVETFGASTIPVSDDQGLTVQLRALGTYIHPPVTKDITSQVAWASNDTQMMTVNSTGMLTATGLTCGSSLVSATVTTNSSGGGISSSGAVVTGYMTGDVVCFSGTGISITVAFLGTGSGGVSSSPAGLSCFSTATNCVGVFPSGAGVTITATPNSGSAFGGWAGCDSVDPSGEICSINDLLTAQALTATFN